MTELDLETKAKIYDLLKDRIDQMRSRYESPRNEVTFNSVFSNGVLAGLNVIEFEFNVLTELAIDESHALNDLSHLRDDRSSSHFKMIETEVER